jgi:two-component system, cell cycle sensor histidine kinase and response regulator CckA
MSAAPTQILLVEDEAPFAEILREILLDEGQGRFTVTIAGRLTETLEQLKRPGHDLVLLDLSLPDQQGLATFVAVKRAAPAVPVIVLTGLNDEEVALQAVRDGAQDYLVKGEFDGRVLTRAIRYALERNQIERKLRQSEEFFRLISENVSDLIAVVDAQGRRIYNSPSYQKVLGWTDQLRGTDSFESIHPEDRDNIRQIFGQVISCRSGQRAEYRFVLPNGSVRHVESQSNVILDESGQPGKVIVVSRDVTDRIQAEQQLRRTLVDLQQSHTDLQAAQEKLIQSEKLEAVSTFAAGVAHEVKNPLQTVILGIDYLNDYAIAGDENTRPVLQQMTEAVQRADAIIRALLDFASYRKRAVSEQNLNTILRKSLRAVQSELAGSPIQVSEEFSERLPLLRLDPRPMGHVFTNLFTTEVNSLRQGGVFSVKTFARDLTEEEHDRYRVSGKTSTGRQVVVARIEARPAPPTAVSPITGSPRANPGPETDFGTLVLRKIIELYGGRVEFHRAATGNCFTISFNT